MTVGLYNRFKQRMAAMKLHPCGLYASAVQYSVATAYSTVCVHEAKKEAIRCRASVSVIQVYRTYSKEHVPVRSWKRSSCAMEQTSCSHHQLYGL